MRSGSEDHEVSQPTAGSIDGPHLVRRTASAELAVWLQDRQRGRHEERQSRVRKRLFRERPSARAWGGRVGL